MSDHDRKPLHLDFDSLRREAAQRMPLSAVMRHYGYEGTDPGTRWTTCPACKREGIWRNSGEKNFRCNHPSCDLNPDNLVTIGARPDALGIIMLKTGIRDWKEAWNVYYLISGAIDQDTFDQLTGQQHTRKKTHRKPSAQAEEEIPPTVEAAPETGPVMDAAPTATPSAATEEPAASEPTTPAEPVSLKSDTPGEPEPASPDTGVKGLNDGNPWHDLWLAMKLMDGDRTELATKRGFSRQTIEFAGYRSSPKSNRDLIEALRAKYEDEDLVEYGILQKKGEDDYRPEPQLYGWGITGEKDPKTGDHVFDWTHPVLIPYFDFRGQCVSIRAHKGGLKKRLLPGDIEFTNYSQPYGENILRAHRGKRWCVLTEGEHKANAIHQCGIPAMAVPGITFIGNPHFRRNLIRVLERNQVHEVVIIFDNEDKSDKSEDKRYDVPIWANVTAHYLAEAGIRARVGKLPDECRVRGKADFDGILASHGEDKARKIFQQAIDEAQKPAAFIDTLFPDRASRYIHGRVIRLTRQRAIAIGGEDEMQKAFLLQKQNPLLAKALRDTNGVYYIRKSVDPKNRKEWTDERSRLFDQIKQMQDAGDSPKAIREARVEVLELEEKLAGWPEPISNFSLTCLYRVISEEGQAHYYCRAWVPMEKRAILLHFAPKALSSLREMREFCNGFLQASWFGGEKDLQAVKLDLDVDSAYRIVSEVNAYGHHEVSGLFILGDCAWDKEGERILPDQDMIYWHGDTGYQIDRDRSKIGDGMQQRAPLMHPEEPEREDLAQAALDWCIDMRDGIGGLEAWGLIGTMTAYFAMPAFFRAHSVQHPGLWLHGVYGEGKTATVRWLMRLAGFNRVNGVTLTPNTTDVAMNRVLAQYSCLPVFFDEYRAEYATPERNGVFRNAFDRTDSAKGRVDNFRRTRSVTASTTPVVCGESECTDPATRSRYVQAVISQARRKPDPGKVRFRRLEAATTWLYQVGRRLLDNRPDFESTFLAYYDGWNEAVEKRQRENKSTGKLNDRAVVTYGVAYSGFAAMVDILGIERLQQPVQSEFLHFLIDYMIASDKDTKGSGVVEIFWEKFVSALHQNKIHSKNVRRAFFAPDPEDPSKVKSCAPHTPGAREVMLINIVDAYQELCEHLRRIGEPTPLSYGNLQKYFKNLPWWVWRATDTGWKLRWNKALRATWGVYLTPSRKDANDEWPWASSLGEVVTEDDNALALDD